MKFKTYSENKLLLHSFQSLYEVLNITKQRNPIRLLCSAIVIMV